MTKKPKQALTPEEQLEMELQVESELSRLQRQYRIMERDRSSYGSGGKLVKQRRVLQILKKEQNNILTDLCVATCSTKTKQDADVNSNLCTLLEENDVFETQIVEKKKHLHEVELQIVKVKKDVEELQKHQITDSQYQEKVMAAQKAVDALENKLDTAIKRFCVILTENNKLRDEIDHLLLERITFNKLWEHLIGNLNKGKSFMMDLIEQATIAYDQREEWVTKLQALRTKSRNDLISHTWEMQELQRKLDNDGKLDDFLGVKGQRRVMRDLEEKELQKKEQQRQRMQQQLEDYKEMLAVITEFTGHEDMEELAEEYVRREEENFGIFNYINVLHMEMEELTGSLVTLHVDIDKQRALNEDRAEHQQSTLDKLEGDLATATEAANQAQSELDDKDRQLKQLYKGIDNLFKICKCSNAPFLELLGDNATINDYNVLLHLQVLEQQVTELIMNVYYKQKTTRVKAKDGVIKEGMPVRHVFPVENIAPTNPCPLCVEQEQVSDVIDTLQFVLTRHEVAHKLRHRITLPDGLERLHNVSACHLPESRQIIQRRYQ